MKLGFSTLGCPKWTLEQAIAQAEGLGFEGIEVRVIDDVVITPQLVREQLSRIKKAFAHTKVQLAALDSSVGFTSTDVQERRKQEADCHEWLALAAELGVKFIRVFGGKVPAGSTLAQAIDNVAESFNRVAPAAEKAGINLVLETHDDFSRAEETAQALSRIGSPNVGAVWDTVHTSRMGESPARVIELMGSRILHTHFKDAILGEGGKFDLVLEGRGNVPNREAVHVLADQGYDGWIILEWEKKWRVNIEEPEIAFPHYYKLLREYMRG